MNLSKISNFLSTNSLSVGYATPAKLKAIKLPRFFDKLSVDFKKISPKKVVLTLVAVVVIAVGILIALSQFGKTATFKQDVRVEIPINRSFKFPVYDGNGKATQTALTMNLTSAQKMRSILIQGKPAEARVGKIFLIINLEVTNNHNQKLQIAPVDLIRLIDPTGKKFAPDVHNETVTVEPISVKKTRIGFVVDETAAGFNLQVGEIDGSKETIKLAI